MQCVGTEWREEDGEVSTVTGSLAVEDRGYRVMYTISKQCAE